MANWGRGLSGWKIGPSGMNLRGLLLNPSFGNISGAAGAPVLEKESK